MAVVSEFKALQILVSKSEHIFTSVQSKDPDWFWAASLLPSKDLIPNSKKILDKHKAPERLIIQNSAGIVGAVFECSAGGGCYLEDFARRLFD